MVAEAEAAVRLLAQKVSSDCASTRDHACCPKT